MIPGRGDIGDVSFELTVSLEHAFRILEWQEGLNSKEMPPEWMWCHPKELEMWFSEVDTMRKQEYGIEDDDWGHDDDEVVPMTSNELSSRFKD